MLTSHLDKISQLTRQGNFDLKTLNTERRDRPLSLEMKPELVAQSNGQSSVLYRVNPVGNVGRFRPRAKRKQESFAERNSRLGYIATRTSVGLIKGKMLAQPQVLAAASLDVPSLQASNVLSPAIVKSETTQVEKRSIERELKDLEHALLPSTEEPPSPEPESPSIKANDQVIYEESVDDCNADLDDLESHISGTLSAFASRQTTRIAEFGRNSLGPQLDGLPLQSKMQA